MYGLAREAVQPRRDQGSGTGVTLVKRKVKLNQFLPGLVVFLTTMTKASDRKKRRVSSGTSFRGLQSIMYPKASW